MKVQRGGRKSSTTIEFITVIFNIGFGQLHTEGGLRNGQIVNLIYNRSVSSVLMPHEDKSLNEIIAFGSDVRISFSMTWCTTNSLSQTASASEWRQALLFLLFWDCMWNSDFFGTMNLLNSFQRAGTIGPFLRR